MSCCVAFRDAVQPPVHTVPVSAGCCLACAAVSTIVGYLRLHPVAVAMLTESLLVAFYDGQERPVADSNPDRQGVIITICFVIFFDNRFGRSMHMFIARLVSFQDMRNP